MPLILTLRKGEEFFVDDHKLVVHEVFSDHHIQVQRPDGAVFDIVDDRATEVMPNVFLSVGDRAQVLTARVAVDAPREVTILRKDMYTGAKQPKERRQR